MTRLKLAPFCLAAAYSLGCSPAADPIAKGGAHYQVTYPTADGVEGSCGLISIGGIGDPIPPELQSGNMPPNSWGTEVTDGQATESGGRYTVECSMTGGDNKAIEITMSGPNTSPQKGGADGLTGLVISGTLDSDGTGEGTVSVRTTTSGVASPNTTCTLEAVPEEDEPPDDAENFQVTDTDARFTFECINTTPSLDQFSTCATRGTVTVRDCIKD